MGVTLPSISRIQGCWSTGSQHRAKARCCHWAQRSGSTPSKAARTLFLRANLLHAKARPIDLVPAQGGDVGVAAMAGQNGERDGSQDILFFPSIGTAVLQGTLLDPLGKQT